VLALFLLIAFPLTSISHDPRNLKNDVAKRLILFDVQKVPEGQKHAKKNKKIYSVVLKPNERRSFRKELESMENMSKFL
jgi:hypothetical protein